MDQDNRRKAARIACELPLRLCGPDGLMDASLLDLSRTGLRLRISGSSLRVHRLSSLVHITARLRGVLGDEFQARLHPDVLGGLITKTLTTTRIAKRDWEGSDVELGCVFSVPLSDEDVDLLGVPVPAIGESELDPTITARRPPLRRPRLNPDPNERAARLSTAEDSRYPAYIYPAPGKTAPPLVTRTASVSRGMAILLVQQPQDWTRPENMDVASVVMALDQAYGTHVMLRIVDEQADLWAGPAEIKEVDVATGSDAEQVKLGVAFGREMDTRDLRRLGLPRPA